ncbi:transporter [Actinoplanes sp. OR16]|uniref:DMT family transporter n=1 Tax=Actinoplanes sp. OR16 TaxID=946334 RepID=UPI000F6CDD68|nr:DMT family transporter [Actinoplanes sp. OR16]BBH68721.1 transporter [Actinoplanes sp. OR16]
MNAFLYTVLTTGWGASFFFTVIALRAFTPLQVVTLRMALAALVLTSVLALRRSRTSPGRPVMPRRQEAVHLLVLGSFNIALPFLLLTAAQRHVPSSLTVVLSATTPVFVFLLATLLRTEQFSAVRLLGVALSFTGVTVLAGLPGGGSPASWQWPLVVVLSSALYAAGNVYTRRHLSALDPLVIAWGQITAGACYLLPALLVAADPWPSSPELLPLPAVLELGVFASAFCYLLFFHFILSWGSTATSFNTYLQPIVGIALGVLVLNEPITTGQGLALTLILIGLTTFAAATLKPRPLPRYAESPPPTTPADPTRTRRPPPKAKPSRDRR